MKRSEFAPPMQLKSARHERRDAVSRGGVTRRPPDYGIAFADRRASENRTGMPDELKANVEALSGIDLSDVRVHRDSSMPERIHAHAFAQGRDIHLARGQDHHLPHEAWHVVQQRQGRVAPTLHGGGMAVNTDAGLEHEADVMGARASSPVSVAATRAPMKTSAGAGSAVIQGYSLKEYTFSTWKQADDLSVVVKDGYPNHELYAKPGKAAAANQALTAANSGIELIQTNTTDTFYEGSYWSPTRSVQLNKVEAKNKQNNTQGDDMLLYADCGKSNAVVVGGSDRQAVYDKPNVGASTAPGGPTAMKTEIMKAWLAADTTLNISILLATIRGGNREGELPGILNEYGLATTDVERKRIAARYTNKLEEVAEAYWAYYNGLTPDEQNAIDQALKINRHAAPGVGQGFTTSSGGPSAGKDTWNFHWGGVVLTSDDNKDRVVLENYAVGDPAVENKLWTFDLYGSKKNQTFHERHKATQQHGTTPTTMTIKKR